MKYMKYIKYLFLRLLVKILMKDLKTSMAIGRKEVDKHCGL